MIGYETIKLPELPLEAWEPTKETLHLYVQIVGKIRLAATPPRNHWWNVPLYADVRGLTTRRMRYGGVSFSIDFDFVDHRLLIRTGDGKWGELSLRDGLSVAEFYEALFVRLAGLGINVPIKPMPYGLPITTPFPEDREHASYDPRWVERYWRVLSWVDWVFQEFAGWFSGKTSPVHLFWHSFDLALSRFSGQPAPVAADADPVTREAYTHELISFGFWPGDRRNRSAVLYSYTHPEPAALAARPIRPAEAFWVPAGRTHLATLPWHRVRTAADPRLTVLDFLQSTYEAGASASGWPVNQLISSWCPVVYR